MNTKNKCYRDNGAIGALLDEYEKALVELQQTIKPLTTIELTTIVDRETKDEDCRSIQSILSHVIRSGYGYIVYLRKSLGEELSFPKRITLDTPDAYHDALNKMFDYNLQFFIDYPNFELEEYDLDKKIKTNWGQSYDGDQILEHAIVHILRHRRQIERFILKLALTK